MIFMIGFQAKVVVELLDTLLENGIPADSIGWLDISYYSLLCYMKVYCDVCCPGVITLYRAQMFEIRKMLSGKSCSDAKAVQVNTYGCG